MHVICSWTDYDSTINRVASKSRKVLFQRYDFPCNERQLRRNYARNKTLPRKYDDATIVPSKMREATMYFEKPEFRYSTIVCVSKTFY